MTSDSRLHNPFAAFEPSDADGAVPPPLTYPEYLALAGDLDPEELRLVGIDPEALDGRGPAIAIAMPVDREEFGTVATALESARTARELLERHDQRFRLRRTLVGDLHVRITDARARGSSRESRPQVRRLAHSISRHGPPRGNDDDDPHEVEIRHPSSFSSRSGVPG